MDKKDMVQAIEATVMFLDTLFAEAQEQEDKETAEEKSFRLFCNNRKQARMLKTGY